ncbi:MAG: TIGR03936 family radical SAM-associated protein [Spirochaetaceae bacterium]|jgi:radical SAM superfamily enzyme YgiQ (UPF0313 family)|nr:TIGR03936 family radical SAM-associated protein [Spirochaetaceae bacterium]
MRFIDPVQELGKLLLTVEKPARYVGGEYGRLAKQKALLHTAIVFPDLYEIALSNQALKILYNRLNRLPDVSCDRACAPAPDFEAVLKKTGIPLYGLDTGIALCDLDLLLFTIGYELGITNILCILDCAGIPLHTADRQAQHPLVIAGGPCVSNPLPLSRFIDAFWIGEAEDAFFDLVQKLLILRRQGAQRTDLFACIAAHPSVWVAGKETARRTVDIHFDSREPSAAVFPVPNMKVVQHHGAVEIMRGCPNGCRFCHAGIWYRPMRQKSADTIKEEVGAFVRSGGYREISLSSLSSGDYAHLGALVDELNRQFSPYHVSFQLPSLRVSSFSLPVLEKIATVRRSGLSFAIETPDQKDQFALNKEVSRDSIIAILQEARKNGWHGAKFYFMIGLPVGTEDEAVKIVDFIHAIARITRMHFTINVGTFVPKPHTPYEHAVQLDEESARNKLVYIRSQLRPAGHKVSVQDPFFSMLEGIISRGDQRIGELIEEAYRAGCRLDAWTEHCRIDIWRSVLNHYPALVKEVLSGKNEPWRCIESGTSLEYLAHECSKSAAGTVTPLCATPCPHYCGVCSGERAVSVNTVTQPAPLPGTAHVQPVSQSATNRLVFSFSKTGPAIFHSHLSIMEIFAAAFIRAGLEVVYSKGFNPLPRLEIAAPLAIGITAQAEIASVDTVAAVGVSDFIMRLNQVLPQGIAVRDAITISIPFNVKKHSLAAYLWGFTYAPDRLVPAREEKAYRLAQDKDIKLERLAVLARSSDTGKPRSYFEFYRELYA